MSIVVRAGGGAGFADRRSLAVRGLATGLLVCAAGLPGCNLIFGLEEVSQRGTGAGGTGGSTGVAGSTTTTSSSGGGETTTACDDPATPGNLLKNGSFELGAGGWGAHGEGVSFEPVPAETCEFACGEKVGRMRGQPPGGGAGTFTLFQYTSPTMELGGKLELSGRYAYTASSQPYFSIFGQGNYIGSQFTYGAQEGEHFVVDKAPFFVADPRRTGNDAQLVYTSDITTGDTESLLDCLVLTYTPPPGTELLANGWFEQGTSGWQAAGGATLSLETENGQCMHAAGRLAVPEGSTGAQLEGSATGGPWPVGTSFQFAGAMGPVTFGAAKPAKFTLTLRVEYAPDGLPGTDDFQEVIAASSMTSEEWEQAIGTLSVTREVTSAKLLFGVKDSLLPADFLTDCFTLRAVGP